MGAWKRRCAALLSLLPSVLALPAHGQEQLPPSGSESELNVFQLEQTLSSAIVESASKQSQPLSDAPAVISVLSRDEVQQYGWLSLNNILFRQPGFSPGQDFERRTVNFRGLYDSWNNNHLLQLIDGVPQNDNLYGTAYSWEITPLFLVQNVEITRGPGSALYGSNATNGVIAINSRSVSDLAGGLEAQLRLGSAGERIYDFVLGHAWKAVSVLVGYNRYETDGNTYSAPDGSGRVDDAGNLQRFRVTDARSSDYGFLKIEMHGKLEGLSLQLHIQNWKYRNAFGWDEYVTDVPDKLKENREVLSLKYKRASGRWSQEYVLQWQRHEIDWTAEFYPAGFQGSWPNGGYEQLDTEGNTLFARAQVGYRIWRDLTLIGGAEENLFLYTGDHVHNANFDVNDYDNGYPPFPDGYRNLGPWLQWVQNKPVSNFGVFLQLATGKLFRNHLSATLGARYDLLAFDYTDLGDTALPTRHRNYQQFSPRAAILIFPHRRVTIKLLGDRAFRAPSPAELFGANSFTVASALMTAVPEQLTTAQLAVDYAALDFLTFRVNGYYERFENQTGYTVLSSTRDTAGVEAEALLDWKHPRFGRFGGFVNYSYAALLSEKVDGVSPGSVLTWVPSHLANLGVRYAGHRVYVSAQLHVQGDVLRRPEDRVTPEFVASRPDRVPAWATLDARVAYDVFDWLRLGLQGSNITNTHGTLVKAGDYPFDFQIQGARVLGTIEAALK